MENTRVREVFLGTGGVIQNELASLLRERLTPTAFGAPEVMLLDLDGAIHTPGGLQTLLLPLALRIQAGEYGPVTLCVRTSDHGVGDFVRYLAQAHELCVFLVEPSNAGLPQPLGRLSTTDVTSLGTVHRLGGQVTVSQFAGELGLEPPAASNRLSGLAKRGYVWRVERGRREGDLFVDPRSAICPLVASEIED